MQQMPATLQEVMQYCRKKKYELPLRQRVEIALQIVDALQYLHTLGIPHHNLHPGNILLSSEFEPVLTDLGMEVFEKEVLHRSYDPVYVDNVSEESEEISSAGDVFSVGRIILYVGD